MWVCTPLAWLGALYLFSTLLNKGCGDAVASSPDVLVQLFEWSFEDIATECETWLASAGVSGVQISPPQEAIQGTSWWTRYQPVSFLHLASRSGDEQALSDMVRRCQAVNVQIIVDVVANHMAAPPPGGLGYGTAGTSFLNRTFAEFAPEDFHHWNGSTAGNCGVDNYADRVNLQSCDFNGLPDLNTASSFVRNKLSQYIAYLLTLGVRGFRVDSALLMPASDIQAFMQPAKDVLIYQEIAQPPGSTIDPAEYAGVGKVAASDFAWSLYLAFKSGQLSSLQDLGQHLSGKAVTFIDSHDLQRQLPRLSLSFMDGKLYELANIFMLAYPHGQPLLMSSYAFDTFDQGPPMVPVHASDGASTCGQGQPWVCEHRTPSYRAMIRLRRQTANQPVTSWQNLLNGSMIAFSRGAGFIAINVSNQTFDGVVSSSLPQGDYINILRESQPTFIVAGNGFINIFLPGMSAVALLAA